MSNRHVSWADYARNAWESDYPELWRGLVGLWVPALGNTGGVLRDVSGRSNRTTISGATWGAAALAFDGSDDYGYPSSDAAGKQASGLSVVVDLTPAAGLAQYDVVVSCVTDAGVGWRLWTRDAAAYKYYWEGYDTGVKNVQSLGAVSAGSRDVLACTHDGANLALWRNGVYQGQAACGAIAYVDANSHLAFLRLGCMVSSETGTAHHRHWPMALRSVAIYSRPVFAGEIQAISADPLAMLRPRTRVWPVAAVEDGDTTSPITGSTSWAWTPSAALLGTGVIGGSSSWAWTPSANIAGTGALDGSATWSWTPTSTLVGTGSLSGSASWSWTPTAAAEGTGDMAGSAAWAWTPTASIAGFLDASGSTTWAWTPTAEIDGVALEPITGSAAWAWSASAALLGTGSVAGSSTWAWTPTATIEATASLSGSSAWTWTAFATMASSGGPSATTEVGNYARITGGQAEYRRGSPDPAVEYARPSSPDGSYRRT